MKKMLLFTLALMLLITVGVQEALASAVAIEIPNVHTLEGPGFASPEEAALAYVDAMNRADMGDMLSAFAMESLIEHLDVDAYLRRMNAAGASFAYAFLPTDEYARQALLYNRYAEKARSLYQQYLEYSADLNGLVVTFQKPGDIEAYYARFEASPFRDMEGHVEFVGWISPALLTEGKIVMAVNGRNSAAQYLHTGADDLVELAAHIRINGADAIQLIQCVRYGDRWFIQELSGLTGTIMGIGITQAGLLLATTPEDMSRLTMALSGDGLLQNEQAIWNALRESDLGGTRWQLQSLDVQGVTLHNSADSAAQDAGMGLWAELQFFSTGGAVVRVQVSSALCEAWQLENPFLALALGWTAPDGTLAVGAVKSVFDKSMRGLFSEAPATFRDGDMITFTLSDGTKAVFLK